MLCYFNPTDCKLHSRNLKMIHTQNRHIARANIVPCNLKSPFLHEPPSLPSVRPAGLLLEHCIQAFSQYPLNLDNPPVRLSFNHLVVILLQLADPRQHLVQH